VTALQAGIMFHISHPLLDCSQSRIS